MLLSDREVAIGIWAAVALLAYLISVAVSEKQRAAFLGLLRALMSYKIIGSAVLCFIWVGCITILLGYAGIWTLALTKETILFGFGTALPLVFSKTLMTGGATVRELAAGMVAPAVLVEFASGLYSFPLGFELALVPLTFVLILTAAFIKKREARTVLEVLVAALGLTYVIYSVAAFIATSDAAAWVLLTRTFVYIVLISAAAIPYAIFFGIWVTFEDKIRWATFNREEGMLHPLKVRLAVLRVFSGRTALLGKTPPVVIMQMTRAGSIKEAVERARNHISRKEQEESAELSRRNSLLEFAGILGENYDGRQLDRREFKETCDALNWLWVCMTGHYDRNKRFRPEVLDFVAPFERQNLPEPHGIVLIIRNDGQSWYAYRTTPSAWVFAIGGNAPRDHWTYDGSTPPHGFPGDDSAWVRFNNATNWEY